MNQRFEMRKLKTVIGCMPNNLTQSAWRCHLWSFGRRRCLESLVLRFLFLGFDPCPNAFTIVVGSYSSCGGTGAVIGVLETG